MKQSDRENCYREFPPSNEWGFHGWGAKDVLKWNFSASSLMTTIWTVIEKGFFFKQKTVKRCIGKLFLGSATRIFVLEMLCPYVWLKIPVPKFWRCAQRTRIQNPSGVLFGYSKSGSPFGLCCPFLGYFFFQPHSRDSARPSASPGIKIQKKQMRFSNFQCTNFETPK